MRWIDSIMKKGFIGIEDQSVSRTYRFSIKAFRTWAHFANENCKIEKKNCTKKESRQATQKPSAYGKKTINQKSDRENSKRKKNHWWDFHWKPLAVGYIHDDETKVSEFVFKFCIRNTISTKVPMNLMSSTANCAQYAYSILLHFSATFFRTVIDMNHLCMIPFFFLAKNRWIDWKW